MSGLTSVKIADSVIQFSHSINILGVALDSSLSLGPHTKAISKSCFYHLRFFRCICLSMAHSTAISVASASVSSRFHYAISVLFGCPQKHIARLQRAQHALARVMTQQSSHSCSLTSTDLLRQLHWLPIEWRTKIKLASLTYKALPTGHPHTSPSLYSIINPPGPRVHLQVTRSQFHPTTFHLVLVLFVSQLPKYGIPYRLTFCSLKHSLHLDVI